MCNCPITNKWCNCGTLEGSRGQCEFWSPSNDCRIRRCLELLEVYLSMKIKELSGKYEEWKKCQRM